MSFSSCLFSCAGGSSHSSKRKCDVCRKKLSAANPYYSHPSLDQSLCYDHFTDGTPVCTSCGRFQGPNFKYFDLEGDLTICPECFSISIKNKSQVKSVLNFVLQFYKEKGMEVRKEQVSVFLVTRNEVGRRTSRGTTLGPVHPSSVLYGLTVHGGSVTSVRSCHLSGTRVIVKEKDYELPEGKPTVMLLYGLPLYMTAAVLAHEMMHAWFAIHGVRGLYPKIEEGISQVMGYEFMDWFEEYKNGEASYDSHGEEAQFAMKLKHLYKHRVETDPSYAYGDGFRDAKRSVDRFGLLQVINYIVRYRSLPT